jgi:hypothetical protein
MPRPRRRHRRSRLASTAKIEASAECGGLVVFPSERLNRGPREKDRRIMPRAKRSIEADVVVDGFSLKWHLHREQEWSAEGGKGVSIHVKATKGTFRELFLEYPPVKTQKPGWIRVEPVQQHIQPKRIEGHIRLAMAAGWNPDSRGKPFVYEVSELPG